MTLATKLAVAVGIVLLLASTDARVDATPNLVPPVPVEEFTDATQLLLAAAWVDEAGWTNYGEHAAIAHTLAVRWWMERERIPGYKFKTMIRQYCTGMHPARVHKHGSRTVRNHRKPRQVWIHELNLQGTKPKHWPKNMSWSKMSEKWSDLLIRSKLWSIGAVADPFDGRSYHWAAPYISVEGKNLYPLRANKLHNFNNVFYGKRGHQWLKRTR
jgi:hypothetical protein